MEKLKNEWTVRLFYRLSAALAIVLILLVPARPFIPLGFLPLIAFLSGMLLCRCSLFPAVKQVVCMLE